MKPPILELIERDHDKIWRVTYAGMVKEHHQEWQAKVFYEQALQLYARRLLRVF